MPKLTPTIRVNCSLPPELFKEIQTESNRQDRSYSWLVQQAWLIARDRLKTLLSVDK